MTFLPEVFLPDPAPGFGRMPATAPALDATEDLLIHQGKGAFARGMAVIHRPALDMLVQSMDHLPCRPAPRAAERLPDLAQERPHAPAGRFHQHLAAAVTADGLSQEIEAVVDMRDPGL